MAPLDKNNLIVATKALAMMEKPILKLCQWASEEKTVPVKYRLQANEILKVMQIIK